MPFADLGLHMGRPPFHALIDEIRAHYSSYFGLPRSRLEVAARLERPDTPGLEVYEFTPPNSALRLFVTAGMSLLSREHSTPELLFAVRKHGPEIEASGVRRLLMTFWLAAHRAPVLLAPGRVLRSSTTLVDSAEHFVLSPAVLLPKGAPKKMLSDGRTIWLGWLVPVRGLEIDYARRNGPLELLEFLKSRGLDPTDLDRRTCDSDWETEPVTMPRSNLRERALSRLETVPGEPVDASRRTAKPRMSHRSDGEPVFRPTTRPVRI